MAKVVAFEVSNCFDCPMVDDMNRCSLLDRGVYNDCKAASEGIRDNCPLPDVNDELEKVLKNYSIL